MMNWCSTRFNFEAPVVFIGFAAPGFHHKKSWYCPHCSADDSQICVPLRKKKWDFLLKTAFDLPGGNQSLDGTELLEFQWKEKWKNYGVSYPWAMYMPSLMINIFPPSIFSSLMCGECGCTVGKVVHAAPQHLAAARSLFLLHKTLVAWSATALKRHLFSAHNR